MGDPGYNTMIRSGDCIYLKVEASPAGTLPDGESTTARDTVAASTSKELEQEARSRGVEVFLEFDEFEFPDHCIGLTVGEMGLRARFGINLACIGRYSEEGQYEAVNIAADTVVDSGDKGLVCRMPDRDTGSSTSIVTDDDLKPLFTTTEFVKRLRNKNTEF